MTILVQSALAQLHRELGAKFAEFGGWEMPLEYAGVIAEHEAVRTNVGLFDVSHLGTFTVEGDGATAYLNTRLSNDLNRITPGQAQYTLLLDGCGGVVDDMIVYVLDDDHAMVIPNAANAAEVMSRLKGGSPAHFTWTNLHQDRAILALQGPKSAEVMQAAGFPYDMDYMSFEQVSSRQSTEHTSSRLFAEPTSSCHSAEPTSSCHSAERSDSQNPESTVGQLRSLDPASRVACAAERASATRSAPQGDGVGGFTVCRTGYTGEMGYELVVPAQAAGAIWAQLMEAGEAHGIMPCGLGARDTLRLEMGYPLHGQDLSLDISPVEARLGWAVGWKKPQFDGCEVVRRQKAEGVSRTLRGIRALGRGIPRAGMVVVGTVPSPTATPAIGEVTSGTFSPTLKLGIGLAFLPSTTQVGDHVLVQVRSRTEEFEVIQLPFVTSHVRG